MEKHFPSSTILLKMLILENLWRFFTVHGRGKVFWDYLGTISS
jgi:hypothetical protein